MRSRGRYVCVEVDIMRYKESRWAIEEIDGVWRATFFFTSTYGTCGTVYNEFETEAEALMYILRWS